MGNIVHGVEAGRGRHLRASMFLSGLTVERVADAMGWSTATLYRVLRDQRALSSDEHAKILQVIAELPR